MSIFCRFCGRYSSDDWGPCSDCIEKRKAVVGFFYNESSSHELSDTMIAHVNEDIKSLQIKLSLILKECEKGDFDEVKKALRETSSMPGVQLLSRMNA